MKNECKLKEVYYNTIKSYVLRTGHMTNRQQQAFEEIGADFIIPFPFENEFNTVVKDFFTRKQATECGTFIVDIGFGNGISTSLMAELKPQNFYIGIEVYPSGVGNLLKLIDEKKLSNVRIVYHDAVEVLDSLLQQNFKIDGFHIFFPDPWQKRKHNKRRIINEAFTEKIIALLPTGGYIYAVTDWNDYSIQMEKVFSSFDQLYNAIQTPKPESFPEKPWRPETNFEKKGLGKSHTIHEFFYIKK